MRLSDKKLTAIYTSVSKPITDLRIKQSAGLSIDAMDQELFDLERKIVANLKTVLKLKRF